MRIASMLAGSVTVTRQTPGKWIASAGLLTALAAGTALQRGISRGASRPHGVAGLPSGSFDSEGGSAAPTRLFDDLRGGLSGNSCGIALAVCLSRGNP